MATKKTRLPFAVNEAGVLVNIKDSLNGLACACYCPGCGAHVVAKQGKNNVWHFSHHNAVECAGGYESAMHLAVKKIIETERALFLPACGVLRHPKAFNDPIQYKSMLSVSAREKPTCFDVWEYTTKETAEQLIRENYGMDSYGFADKSSKRIEFNAVIMEKNEGNIRPDIIGIFGDRKLYIEVAVTHFIDEVKLTKIRNRGVSTVEIVVPEMDGIDWEKLREIVLTNGVNTYWRFNPKVEQMAEASHQARLVSFKKKRETVQREVETKRRVFEQLFKPTHEVSLRKSRWTFGNKIFVRLCPANLNISVYPYDPMLGDIMARVARKFYGKYNPEHHQWVFLRNEDLFFQIIKTFRSEPEALSIVGWKYMDDPTNESFLRRIGYQPATN